MMRALDCTRFIGPFVNFAGIVWVLMALAFSFAKAMLAFSESPLSSYFDHILIMQPCNIVDFGHAALASKDYYRARLCDAVKNERLVL